MGTMSLIRMTSRSESLPKAKGEGRRSSKGQELSHMMIAMTPIIKIKRLHPKETRRRSKAAERIRKITGKGLVKMVTDLTQMRDGTTMMREIGMILCLCIKGEPEAHLRRCSTQ